MTRQRLKNGNDQLVIFWSTFSLRPISCKQSHAVGKLNYASALDSTAVCMQMSAVTPIISIPNMLHAVTLTASVYVVLTHGGG